MKGWFKGAQTFPDTPIGLSQGFCGLGSLCWGPRALELAISAQGGAPYDDEASNSRGHR